jgi:serine/threonine-protein kinase
MAPESAEGKRIRGAGARLGKRRGPDRVEGGRLGVAGYAVESLVLHKPTDQKTRGRLRALSDWLRGSTPSPPPASSSAAAAAREGLPRRIGHYAITGKLGQGGMGVVYLAHDERLGRAVAVKTMSSVGGDDTARKRFWREARAAASVNHPNVCQLYEIGEDGGELFIAMEVLEGEALAERLRRGPLSVSETLPIGLGILAALQALHSRGIVHRDLKPSNVFLTSHGVKLLDFGLARAADPVPSQAPSSATELTRTGMVLGTPRYMAPEQVTGESLDARSDLFAAGAILFEMLAGRPAFDGRNAVEILHATVYEQPPALTGSPAVAAADRVIRRALAKRPAERPASADVMAEELRAVRGIEGDNTPALARALTRIVVLPFRILRPDPETDFLAFSLPDAIATSLARIRSLVVRSSATAARFGSDAPDLKALATEADVDRVVMGTLVRAGDQLRATTQLVETPGGTLLKSHTIQSPLGDLFQLQDDIAKGVVDALALPLGALDSPTPEAPHNARAYALYLRANELARSYGTVPQARDLYLQCLELDSDFAPAWAQLGRCRRVISKFIDGSQESTAGAEAALARALELDPRLSVAHKNYAALEADTGKARAGLVRLLGEAARHGNDPELFAGLVHACRYCGLFEQSIAAHEEARRLDPNVPTSVEGTILMTGDIERLLATEPPAASAGADSVLKVIGLGLAGRRDEALRSLDGHRKAAQLRSFHAYADSLQAWLERRPGDLLATVSSLSELTIMADPEALFQMGWLLCDVGEHERGLIQVRRALDKGYSVAPTLAGSPAFDALRGDPAFEALLAQAEAGRGEALRAFRENGGERLLGR